MKRSLPGLAALAVMASLSSGLQVVHSDAPQVKERTGANQQQGDRGQQAPSDTKSARLGTGYIRRHRAPVGKRYSASVRQHQRNALKARRRAAAR